MIRTRFFLVAASVAAILHQWPLRHWWVEDAAISFSFARSLSQGWGPVPMPGLERVEGYSDPLWVFLLTLGECIGLDGFTTAKPLSAVLTVVALVATFAATRRLADGWAPHLAVVLLASSSTFAIWAASGLENALFGALLALGLWRRFVEVEEGGHPWSAVAFLGLALTRPEGIAYAAMAFGWGVVARPGARPAFAWLAVFGLPLVAYHTARFAVFAQEFPAPYHAKLASLDVDWTSLSGRGWRTVGSYLTELGVAWLVLLIPVALSGARGRRAAVSLVAVALGGLAMFGPLVSSVNFGLLFLAVCMVSATAGRRGTLLPWACVLIGIAFTVYTNGDWMRGYRWLSLIQVPLVMLLAVAARSVAEVVERHTTGAAEVVERHSLGVAALVCAVWAIPNLVYSSSYDPETSPQQIKRRVIHYHRAKLRLDLDRPYQALDHDMGAMLWWGGEQGRVIDAKGLTDLPFALQDGSAEFSREYIWERLKPDFVHGHAHAGAELRLGKPAHPDYVEIPGYATSATDLHVGNLVRRELLRVRGTERVKLSGVSIRAWEVRSPEVSPGAGLHMKLGWSRAKRGGPRSFRCLGFLAEVDGDALQVFDLAPGFDDWLRPAQWQVDEVVGGTYPVLLRNDLPEGTYVLGALILDGRGEVILPVDLGSATQSASPFLAHGEVHLTTVSVVSRQEMADEAAADLADAHLAAKEGHCEDAEEAWADARAHRILSKPWKEANRPMIARALARCWARRAREVPPMDAPRLLERARDWNLKPQLVWTVGAEVADMLSASGAEAWANSDWELAFQAYDGAARASLDRPWARRWAEQVRPRRW